MIVGAILYGILGPIVVYPSGSYNTIILPAIIIPLFFGLVYGPWVGLFIGAAGSLLGIYIVHPSLFYPRSPLGILAFALMGFLVGLSIIRTQGRYNNIRSIAIADTIGAFGIIVGLGLYIILLDIRFLGVNFTRVILPTMIFSLVFLPILLVVYNKIITRMRRA